MVRLRAAGVRRGDRPGDFVMDDSIGAKAIRPIRSPIADRHVTNISIIQIAPPIKTL